MMVKTEYIEFNTKGPGDIVNMTAEIQSVVGKSGITAGTVTVFAPGSTTGITTIEYEPGLLRDLPQLMEKLVPSDRSYSHDETWGDGNGFSHLRSAMIGCDMTVPFDGGKLLLGTGQQIVFCEFDNRARHRRVILQIMGE
ncbi:MAG: secondary thiamine-phosphate synthase enzyme YjbQ [Candidatus Zixiibacteriota bacterium]